MKRLFKDRSGMTLVELIVTFALIGIFMTAASFVLSSSLQLFTRMKATADAVTVSDLLLDKIAGEIAAAKDPDSSQNGRGYYFWLSQDGVGKPGEVSGSPWVVFENRMGSPVAIYASNPGGKDTSGPKNLVMKYYRIEKKGKGDLLSVKSRTEEEIDWHFDERAYMGYQIQKLSFYQPDEANHPNVIQIRLTLTNPRTGFTYDTERYASNYNFTDSRYKICARGDGNDMPDRAEVFEVAATDPDPGPDPGLPETAAYTVKYVNSKTGDPIWPDTTGEAEIGTTIRLDASSRPEILNYVYDAVKSGGEVVTREIMQDPAQNVIVLYYIAKGDLVKYTVRYIDANTWGSIKAEESGWAIRGERVYVEPPSISGYRYNAERSTNNVRIDQSSKVILLAYDKIAMGNYLLICHVDSGYQGNYTVRDSAGDYSGSGSRSKWELYQEKRQAPLEDNGKDATPPSIIGYTPKDPYYKIHVDQYYAPSVQIPYIPLEVKVTVYAKCGEDILDETVLTGRYDSIIDLHSEKDIPGYKRIPGDIKIAVNDVNGVIGVFEYENNAPFPPKGSSKVEKPSQEKEPELYELTQKVADLFADFFKNGWATTGSQSSDIGYRTFTGTDGETYVIAGCLDLKYLEDEDKEKERELKLEEVMRLSGADKEHVILLTDDELKDDDAKRLWKALISQMPGISDKNRKLLLECEDIEIEFDDYKTGGKERYNLEKVSFDFPERIDEEAEIKYKVKK